MPTTPRSCVRPLASTSTWGALSPLRAAMTTWALPSKAAWLLCVALKANKPLLTPESSATRRMSVVAITCKPAALTEPSLPTRASALAVALKDKLAVLPLSTLFMSTAERADKVTKPLVTSAPCTSTKLVTLASVEVLGVWVMLAMARNTTSRPAVTVLPSDTTMLSASTLKAAPPRWVLSKITRSTPEPPRMPKKFTGLANTRSYRLSLATLMRPSSRLLTRTVSLPAPRSSIRPFTPCPNFIRPSASQVSKAAFWSMSLLKSMIWADRASADIRVSRWLSTAVPARRSSTTLSAVTGVTVLFSCSSGSADSSTLSSSFSSWTLFFFRANGGLVIFLVLSRLIEASCCKRLTGVIASGITIKSHERFAPGVHARCDPSQGPMTHF